MRLVDVLRVEAKGLLKATVGLINNTDQLASIHSVVRAHSITHPSQHAPAYPDDDHKVDGTPWGAQARRLIVFVVGSVTHSERRAARKLSGKLNRDIILGGTSVATPAAFLQSMRELCIGALVELKHSK